MWRQDCVWLCFILSETGGEKEGKGKHLQGSGHRDNVWSHKKGLLKARRVSYGVCRTEC